MMPRLSQEYYKDEWNEYMEKHFHLSEPMLEEANIKIMGETIRTNTVQLDQTVKILH